MRKNSFLVYSVCDKIVYAYAQSPRKCLNFEILAKIEEKEAKFFFKNLSRAYKDLIKVKKNSKLFHACVPLIHLTI